MIHLHLSDKIRHETNKGNYAGGTFVDFQRAFATADRHILLKKVEYYGVREISIKCSASYFTNQIQLMSNVRCLKFPYWDLLSCIYINGLHVAIKYCEVYHFEDDTNLLNCNSRVKSMNKQVTYNLKHLGDWLKANEVSLNIGKTELVFLLLLKNNLNVM